MMNERDLNFLSVFARSIVDMKSIDDIHWFSKHLLINKLQSKKWLCEELKKIISPNDVCILGSWYPTFLPHILGDCNYTCVDIDQSVINVSKKFNSRLKHRSNFKYICADAKNFIYSSNKKFDCIINTSCEHMKYDMKDLVVKDCVYAFQSNNYNIEEHINYKNDLKEFIDSTGLNNILFSGTKKLKKYDRYMVIGKV